jgi:MurNAc alpha-1-phosphate uridylyltransferase
MAKGLVSGEHYQGAWWDIGTLERLNQLNAQLYIRSLSTAEPAVK